MNLGGNGLEAGELFSVSYFYLCLVLRGCS